MRARSPGAGCCGEDTRRGRPSRPRPGRQPVRRNQAHGGAHAGNGYISQPTTMAESDERGEGIEPEARARLRRVLAHQHREHRRHERREDEQAGPGGCGASAACAPDRDVVGVEHHQDVQQAGHLGEGVAVLEGHRASRCPSSKPSVRATKYGRPDGHLGQAEQGGEDVVEAEVMVRAGRPWPRRARTGRRCRPGRPGPCRVRPQIRWPAPGTSQASRHAGNALPVRGRDTRLVGVAATSRDSSIMFTRRVMPAIDPISVPGR